MLINDGHPAKKFSSGYSCQTNERGPESSRTIQPEAIPRRNQAVDWKACNKNWCCLPKLWDPGIVPLQVSYMHCHLSHHLSISGRNAAMLVKLAAGWLLAHLEGPKYVELTCFRSEAPSPHGCEMRDAWAEPWLRALSTLLFSKLTLIN